MNTLKKKIERACRYIGEDGRCRECGVCSIASDMYEAIKAAIRISELWQPSGEVKDEYIEEYLALNNMFDAFEAALKKAEGEE